MGALEQPRTDSPVARESLRVVGWALFLHSAVGYVDILIDGRAVGRARLGLPRTKVRASPAAGGHPAASVCGFEWIPGPGDLPDDRDRICLEARATSVEGETFELSLGEEVLLEPPEPPFEDGDGYALGLRRSTERLLGPRTFRAGEGTRVLAFTHRLDHGGAQRYFFEQIRYLLQDPSTLCTVVAPIDGAWRRRLETIGADVHLTTLPAIGVAEYESAVAQLAAWARLQEFDVVFANTLDTFLGADLGARLGLPVAWSIHESFSVPSWWLAAHGRDGHAYVRERLEHALRQASALIFAADATRRLYEPSADPSRMVTAPYGLELGDIDVFRRGFDPSRARRRRAAFPEDAVLLLCLGTINARKAQAVLVQAFGLVAGRHPSAHLVLVGDSGGGYSDGIRTFVAEAGLEGRCTLVPVTSDPYSWHEVADVFVLSSDIESSPISILEAMAFDTPVVASNVFGVPELIEDGRHGYLCEASDVADLARCLDRVLSADPAERQRVARAGAERVRRRHDPSRYARSLRRLLIDLSEDPAARPSWEPEPERPAYDSIELEDSPASSAAAEDGAEGQAKPWPTVRGELRALIRAAGRAERHVADAGALDSLLGYGFRADPALADRIACLERVYFTGATVLEVGSRLGEVSRAVRALGAEIVDGVQFEQGLVTLAGLINAYRHTSRVSFHADLAELAARGERYDVAIVSATVGAEEASKAAELAERAVILELPGEQAQGSALAAALAPGFTSRTPLGEIEGIGEPAILMLLARDEEALRDLVADTGSGVSPTLVGGEVQRA
ncbi:MAG: glycosyltransferase family 4 protein [Thermoleophilaceae bacterium]|nr:glycosyltransferase family 4 protein [Thermoleophilaceae bacterium]